MQEMWTQDFRKFQPDAQNMITLPKETGHYPLQPDNNK